MKLHKEVRELVEKVEPIGWKFAGKVNGEGHPIMEHESGRTFCVPSTPGDWRSLKNSLASMESMAGRKIERAGKRRASRKGFQGSGFSIDEAKREQGDFHRSTDVLPVAELWEQRRALIERMLVLVRSDGDRTDEAATTLWKIRATERGLKNLGQSVREFDLMDLPIDGATKEAAKASLKPSAPKPDPKIRQLSEKAAETATRKRAKVDDFDGKLLLGDTEPWEVELMGKRYALYLSPDNQAMVEEFLTNLTHGAKVIPKTRRPRKPTAEQEAERKRAQAAAQPQAAAQGDDPKVVRAWLRENGFPDIAVRGRFSAEHMAAWNSRNKRARRLAKSA